MTDGLAHAMRGAALHNLIRIAEVVKVDGKRACVRVDFGGGALSAWLAFHVGAAGGDRIWRAPQVGEKVLVLSPSGQTSAGCVLPGFYTRARPAPEKNTDVIGLFRKDGARLSHDAGTHHAVIDATPAGTIELVAGPSRITIDAGGVRITAPRIELN